MLRTSFARLAVLAFAATAVGLGAAPALADDPHNSNTSNNTSHNTSHNTSNNTSNNSSNNTSSHLDND